MAIFVKDFKAASGLVFDAYIRVTNPAVVGKNKLNYVCTVHANSDLPAVCEYLKECTYPIGDNPFGAAYADLKTLPEFEGAVDV